MTCPGCPDCRRFGRVVPPAAREDCACRCHALGPPSPGTSLAYASAFAGNVVEAIGRARAAGSLPDWKSHLAPEAAAELARSEGLQG